ncbi:hypothetical protein P154DRAFT_558596 [Amniculicola lignicola CBS 123094]|uniref:Uncharacterized protein n=1 Tax=Amniculicola lignicola CBS 123094 TaxID=1392246 RepID=A0A6A5X319_9PLEO|nr:hypothetical protein P154DRAFT_558596 [Amniculicola lignicola CBS 123094]
MSGSNDYPKCPVCNSKITRPTKPVVNNPFEIGICMSASEYDRVRSWAVEKQEQAKAAKEYKKATGYEEEQNEFKNRRTRAIDRECLKIEGEEAKEMVRHALEIEMERLFGKNKNGEEPDEIEDVWTMWLVGTEKQKDMCVHQARESPTQFNIKSHLVPATFEHPSEGLDIDRKRDVWMCVGDTSEEQWDSLRRCINGGKEIWCEMTDASGQFRVEVGMRNLRPVEGLIKNSFHKLVRKKRSETDAEKRTAISLCVSDEYRSKACDSRCPRKHDSLLMPLDQNQLD